MYRTVRTLFLFFFIVCFFACHEKESVEQAQAQHLFKKLAATQSGITFSNDLTENDSLNYFTYAYIYMGGGISAGDINNDGLTDLFFTGNMVPNKLYLNKGNLQFEDISEKAGISGDARWYTGTTMSDVNNDGYLDIYCSVGGKYGSKENQLFINNGNQTFTEMGERYGIADESNSVQATFFDYDLDGDLDLYVANYPPTPFDAPNYFYAFKQKYPKKLETDRLYRNDGDFFTDVSKEAGLHSFGLSLSATVGDINKDGWPDIYVSNDFSSPDYLFINNKNGTFSDQVRHVTKNTSFYGMGVDIADFNNDQLLDILQVDMTAQNNRRSKANMASMNPDLFWSTVHSGFHYQYMQNSLQLNNGMLSDTLPDFSNIARLAGVSSTDWSWGPLFADLDNDGWKDIFISNGTRREINNRDFFLGIEKKGVPKDSSLQKSLAIPSEKIDNFVFKNKGDLTFQKVNKAWGIEHKGFSNGSVYVDLDNDGDLEIITNNIDGIATVFENKSAETNNFVGLKFKGPQKNRNGIGVKALVFHDKITQYQEMTLTRGFQSSVAPQFHFGLGQSPQIDSIQIIWPDQKSQTLVKPKINTLLLVEYLHAKKEQPTAKEKGEKIFQNKNGMATHRHIENFYDDFAEEILLPHQTSMFGPNIGVGDLNGDGLDDFVIGGAANSEMGIFIQEGESFKKLQSETIAEDSGHEDLGIHIFDADNDRDNDIYVVSGGNEFEPNSPMLQDRLYVNDGLGNFKRSTEALPELLTSGSRAKSFDFDKDGDLDVFVGGRLVPGNYPAPATSYILENQGSKDSPKFVDATARIAPDLKEIGLVTDASWTDFDNDGWVDLVIVGEWMPITLLKNDQGYFTNVTEKYGLNESRGWWFSIKAADFDEDGDTDFVVGNLGLNYKYQANEKETFDVYFNDFDSNNTGDIVLSYFNDGEKFPVRGRECSSQQMPAIKQKFKNYASFSEATLEDVYSKDNLKNALHYQVKSFASVYLENKQGSFESRALPNMAQLSSINQMLINDYDQDNHLDLVIAGNLHGAEVETPRNDASNGLLLKGDGKGNFTVVTGLQSGLFAKGDVKDLAQIKIKGQHYIIVAKNNDYIQFIKVNG
ncbi:MAG: FG-GAP-like repeat-containing protein [Bacteroidota bacterium]